VKFDKGEIIGAVTEVEQPSGELQTSQNWKESGLEDGEQCSTYEMVSREGWEIIYHFNPNQQVMYHPRLWCVHRYMS